MHSHAGKINIQFPQPLVSGQLVTVKFQYTVGKTGMREGGRLRIGLPSVAWAQPEVPQYYFWSEFARGKKRRYTQYDRVNTTAKLKTGRKAVPLLETDAWFFKPWSGQPKWLTEYDRFWITLTLEDDGLSANDKITVTYGDPDQLPLTARVQGFPEERINFLVFVDATGNGHFHEVNGSPWMSEVRSGPANRLDVISPSIVQPDERPEVRVAYTDQVKGPTEPLPCVDNLRLEVTGMKGRAKGVRVKRKTDAVRVALPQLAAAGARRRARHVVVRDTKREWQARSNPTLVRARGPRLFWGDLHAQSQYHGWNEVDQKGMSCHLPKECYRYARDLAGLDFCAVTDTWSITKDIWRDTVEQADKMYEPGRFVTFRGSEVGDNFDGHRNLLFRGDVHEPVVEADTPSERGVGMVELETVNMQQRYAHRTDVLLVPHHTKMWASWDCHKPRLERVLEIYSIWGSGEKAGTDQWEILREMTGGAQEAWARGYRLGVIAGSDTHTGLPGRSIPGCDRDDFMPYKCGLAGVWADELTRESIFNALYARCCYGTTGVRIILETFVDDHPMGSEVNWPRRSSPRDFRINVCATSDLSSVTVVKNNDDVHTFTPRGDHAELVWRDKAIACNGDYYYVRVIQGDGERAWSSPIWLDVPG